MISVIKTTRRSESWTVARSVGARGIVLYDLSWDFVLGGSLMLGAHRCTSGFRYVDATPRPVFMVELRPRVGESGFQ